MFNSVGASGRALPNSTVTPGSGFFLSDFIGRFATIIPSWNIAKMPFLAKFDRF